MIQEEITIFYAELKLKFQFLSSLCPKQTFTLDNTTHKSRSFYQLPRRNSLTAQYLLFLETVLEPS